MPAADRLAGFLSVLQLSDSAFPSGRYTLSHGLEAFAQAGLLDVPSSAATLEALLADCVRFGVAPSDGVALACACRAVPSDGAVDVELVVRADRRLSAVKLARESREASIRSGRALLRAARAVAGVTMTGYAQLIAAGYVPGNHAVVLGLLDGLLEVQPLEAVAGELYAFSAGWVAAAVRLGLSDHLTAQRVLRGVRPVLADAAEWAAGGDVADISSCAPLPDVMSMRHENAELRLFAS
jgi:urease accessory protein